MLKSKLLVTGCTGFVGKNFMEFVENNKQFHILSPTHQELDLTNQQSVFNYFEEHRPDFVVHLAGLVGGIYANKQRKADFFYENCLMGTLIFEASRRANVQKLVVLGAGCGYPATYEDNLGAMLYTNLPFFPSWYNSRTSEFFEPYKESEIFDGFPEYNSYGYSMAKKNLIVQSMAYKEQYDLNSTVLIPANIYGPHDYFNSELSHVVPALIGKAQRAKQNNENVIKIWGDGKSTREFLYVEDLCKVIIESLKLNWAGPINVGSGIETNILDLMETIVREVGIDYSYLKIEWEEGKPTGQNRRVFDTTRFQQWFPNIQLTTIEEGIHQTVQWLGKNEK